MGRRFPSVLKLRPSSSLCSRRQWSVASFLDFVGSYLVRLRPTILSTADFVLSYSESVCARLRRGLTLRLSLLAAAKVDPLEQISVRSAWVSFCCGWRWRGRMVLPCRRMNSRGCDCLPLSSPFLERPIPAKINQDSNNKDFNQKSHTKSEVRRRSWTQAILIFVWELPRSDRGRRPGLQYSLCTMLPLGMAFNQDHVCPGGAVPHFARFTVL